MIYCRKMENKMAVIWMLVLISIGFCLARPQINPPAQLGSDLATALNRAPKVDIGNVSGVPVVGIPLPVQVQALAPAQDISATQAANIATVKETTVAATTTSTSTTTTTTTEATTAALPASTETVQSSVASFLVVIPTVLTVRTSGTEAEGAGPAPGSSGALGQSATTIAPTTTTAQAQTGLIGLTNAPKSAVVKVHLGEWQKGATYQVGDEVDYKGGVYRAVVHHTAEGIDWTPPQTPSMWIKVSPP